MTLEIAAGNGDDPVLQPKVARAPPDGTVPAAETRIERVFLDHQQRLRRGIGSKTGQHIVQRLADAGEGRMGADLVVRRQLQREQEIARAFEPREAGVLLATSNQIVYFKE